MYLENRRTGVSHSTHYDTKSLEDRDHNDFTDVGRAPTLLLSKKSPYLDRFTG